MTPLRQVVDELTRIALYTEVADVYRQAALRGEPPKKAVEDHFAITSPTASRYIAAARAADLLPPTTRGRGMPGPTRKMVAVADALGVSVADLRAAVLEHASGVLYAPPD